MITITSEAGRRLAKAKAELDEANAAAKEYLFCDTYNEQIAKWKFEDAARVVANDLVARGFHNTESTD